MQELRKERLIIALIIIAQTGFIIESLYSGWELWVPPLICLGIITMLWIHFSQKIRKDYRLSIYFTLAAISVFFVGSHQRGLVNPAMLVALLMTSFSLFDRILYLNISLFEYAFIILYRISIFCMSGGRIDGYYVADIIAHLAALLTVYFLCRISVSDRILTRKKIESYKESMEEDQNDVGDFLSNISHELRTPVNVISGMTALILKDEDRKELYSIGEACLRLTHQIDDIQNYTEVRRGELTIRDTDYMCDSLINDAVSYFRSVERKKHLELIIDLAPETPAVLRGDIEKLSIILRHLIDNALKFTKKGGVYLKVYPAPRDYGINLIIEVTDTGIGMTRAQIARLSTGMYQANKKRTRSTGGIGLGYTIIYGFVRMMGGFVKISSEKGHGTTVRLSIPQQVIDSSPALSIAPGRAKDLLYYIKSAKTQVPELREYSRSMTATLAAGLGLHIYAALDRKDFSRLLNELDVSHIFTDKAVYDSDKDYFESLSGNGYHVIVSTDADRSTASESGVLFVPRPVYGSTLVRIINGEYEDIARSSINSTKLSFAGMKALVVDDEPMNLVVATGIFKEYGLIVDTSESGPDAISKFGKNDYDVVFMDHMMPEMDGVEAMKRIRLIASENNRNPKILALTANVLSGARDMFMQEGFDGFLAKPINITEFERLMKNVLPEKMIQKRGGHSDEIL